MRVFATSFNDRWKIAGEPTFPMLDRDVVGGGKAGAFGRLFGVELAVSGVTVREATASRPALVSLGELLSEKIGAKTVPEALDIRLGLDRGTIEAEAEASIIIDVAFGACAWKPASANRFPHRAGRVIRFDQKIEMIPRSAAEQPRRSIDPKPAFANVVQYYPVWQAAYEQRGERGHGTAWCRSAGTGSGAAAAARDPGS